MNNVFQKVNKIIMVLLIFEIYDQVDPHNTTSSVTEVSKGLSNCYYSYFMLQGSIAFNILDIHCFIDICKPLEMNKNY